jgi:acetylornithine deacetylase/succinyl-diaminopimelate desuccinylase-like protein
MAATPRAVAYARSNRDRFVSELARFVRFPSVSAQPRHSADIRRCAAWLRDHMRSIGVANATVLETGGHPVVTGHTPAKPGRPTVLVYGHYDVQPPEPLNEWKSPPFQPQVREGSLYGRGSCDDKGQMFAHVKAVECSLRTGGPPVNVKFLFEGEEEIGSPNLRAFLDRHRDRFAARAVVMSDSPMFGPDQPALTYSMRGAANMEIEVSGPARDLHSGIFGGAIHNPIQALCEILAGLHDSTGRIAIPGFYDDVAAQGPDERAFMARNGPSDRRILRDAGARQGWGEDGYTLYERTTIRPALTVNGISGGYQGPGNKGVIPSRAAAKLSFRLAPGQSPARAVECLREHVRRATPPTVRTVVRSTPGAAASAVNRNDPFVRAGELAYRRGFGVAPRFLRCGGTIPVVAMFQDVLRAPVVLMGFALPDDKMHSPNERFRLANFHRGVETSLWFLAAAAVAPRLP